MLSIVPIKKSSIETGYYLKQDGNYYIEDVNEKELYQWMGKGAERLGLVGAIDAKDHADVYNGVLPGNIVVGKRNKDGTLAGRPGYDLTFSMNKELSLIVCCTEDKSLKDYFLNAHINAVKTAMHEVEKMASARKSVNGIREYELTKNIVASLCTHFSSRASDPQVHTHALVANMTEREDGQWRALSTDMQRKHGFYEKIRDNGTFLGHIYQNKMAIAARAKGFEVTPVNKHGMFAISSFPDDIKNHFSKRRQQIVSIVDSLQHADKNDKILYNHVAQHSKAGKEKINHRDFMAKSKGSMQQFLDLHHAGKSFDDITHKCINPKINENINTSVKSNEALLDAISSLSRFSVTLDANRLIEKAMQLDLGSSSISELQSSLNQLIQSGVLHKTDSGHFTSQSLIESENRLTQKIEHSKHVTQTGPLKNPPSTIFDAMQQHRLCVIEEPKQLDAKLNLIDTLVNDLESKGKKVTLLTQTKSLACDHNEHDRSHQKSLWQQLKRIGKSDRAQSLYGFLHRYEESTKNPISNMMSGKGTEVFLIDDGQRLSLDVAERLIDLTKKRQANLIFLSNSSGKQSQLAGDVVSLLKKAGVPIINSASQKTNQEKSKLSITIHELKSDLNMNGKEKQTHRQKIIAKSIVNQYGANLKEVEVLSTTKNSALSQSLLIRESLKKQGLLDQADKDVLIEKPVYLTTEERKHAKFFKKGWVAKTYVGRGQFAEKTITGIDKKNNRLLVRGNFGREKLVSPQQILKGRDTKLIERSHLPVANHDHVRLNANNRLSKQLGLSTNTGYQAFIQDNKITLVPENIKLKTIKTKLKNLNGMDWTHDYVKTTQQVRHIKRSSKKVVLDAPAYALDKNTINDLSRQYSSITIHTDNQKKAEKKLNIEAQEPLASELKTEPYQHDLSVVKKAVNYGISIIASREAAFTYQSVVKKSLSYGIANVSFEEVRQELKERVKSGELMARQGSTGEVLIATQETVQLEKQIIAQIQLGKKTVTPFISHNEIQHKLDASTLTKGQKEAVTLLATTQDRFVMIQGYSGTGKSTMLQTLQDALYHSQVVNKESIIALAPTHKAVKELQSKGIEAQTLKSFLVDEAQLSQNNYQHLENKLVLLDESSMVGNRDFLKLQSIVEKAKTCHCAYIGDTAQLLSVEDGKPSEIVYISREADIATSKMTEVLRQKNLVLKKVAQELIVSTPKSLDRAFTQLVQNGCVIDEATLANNEKGKNETVSGSAQKLAEYYCALSSQDRTDTLIAAATNKNRQAINVTIRVIRQNKGELQGDSVTTQVLIDSRLTDAELHHCPNYKVGDVVRLNNQYLTVIKTDPAMNTLILKDAEKREKLLNLDLIPNQTILELFHQEAIDVQLGDILKWTKSDKERGLVAHESLRVTHVSKDKQSITAISEKGDNLTIDLNQLHNQHIDYQYASTVHGLQGATAKSILMLLDSKNTLSNTMRLLYVAATRSTDDVRIFTDSLKAVRDQILHEKGDKKSALEAMSLLAVKEGQPATSDETKPSNKILTNTSPIGVPINGISQKQGRLDAKLVEDELRAQVQTVCEDLFGKPNASLSNAANWRYGRKGSLSITVAGQHQGSFCNFETGDKGGMVQLLMSELGVDFRTALEQGHRMLGGDMNIQQKPKQNLPPVAKKSIESNNKTAYVNSLVRRSVPVAGTLAEKYLANRSIKHTSSRDLRFIKRVSTGTGNKQIRPFSSALMAIARDKDGNLKTIQLTYLDPKTGARIKELKVEKRTLSSPKGSAVNLTPDVQTPKITFAAEGVETALSIKDATPTTKKDHIQVLVSLGISNFPNIADVKSADNIILVLDNDKDNQKQVASIKAAIAQMEQAGKRVVCIQPKLLNDQKTDYNDLAQVGHVNLIRKDINQSIEQIKNLSKADTSINNIQTPRPAKQNITKSTQVDREPFG